MTDTNTEGRIFNKRWHIFVVTGWRFGRLKTEVALFHGSKESYYEGESRCTGGPGRWYFITQHTTRLLHRCWFNTSRNHLYGPIEENLTFLKVDFTQLSHVNSKSPANVPKLSQQPNRRLNPTQNFEEALAVTKNNNILWFAVLLTGRIFLITKPHIIFGNAMC